MTSIGILIRGEHDFPGETLSGLEERDIKPVALTFKECIIIEKMTMPGGRTGVVFLLQDENGKHYEGTITADLIQYGIYSAIKGANERWNVPPRP